MGELHFNFWSALRIFYSGRFNRDSFTSEVQMNAKNFGPNLKSAMEMLGVNQAWLVEKTDLTPAAISQILSGKRDPSLRTVILILEAIPISFEKLMKVSTYERLSCKKAK